MIFTILIALGVMAVFIMSYIGLGFLTDSVFKDKKPSEYDDIYRTFMKMFVVISWLILAMSILKVKSFIVVSLK